MREESFVSDRERRENGEDKPMQWGPGSAVGVIGGLGEMGRLFSAFFRERGYRVEVADLQTGLSSRQAVEASDIVVFAVPLHLSVDIIRELVPHTRPDQLLIDLTSLKVATVKEMLASRASVLGLHPMFGGRIETFAGQSMVACPVRIEPSMWRRIARLFTDAGIRVKECAPEEHDRMMSIIQVLFHMLTMLKGRVLRELGVDIAETMAYTSPIYRMEINLVGRMFSQSPELYSAIAKMNPYTREILDQLKQGLESYDKWYDDADLDAFIKDFEQSSKHLGKDFCGGAYEESSAFLDFVVRSSVKGGPPDEKA